MPEYYHTLHGPSEGLYKEKGSKFLAFAYPVDDEEAAKNILDNLRKEYHDARHHCYAWVMGSEAETIRANDDGEPSNSAGKPILGQINSFGLTNVMIVVVRYFGGKLLGVGGLINAYRSAAKDALQKARIKKEYLHALYELKFQYQDMNTVMTILKEINADQFDQDFRLECTLKAKIRISDKTKFEKALDGYPNIALRLIKED
ncbi:MAG: IMPACT family protein [Bacteroidales bacterium]